MLGTVHNYFGFHLQCGITTQEKATLCVPEPPTDFGVAGGGKDRPKEPYGDCHHLIQEGRHDSGQRAGKLGSS